MKLINKTILYSLILSSIVTLFMLLYLFFLLPNLFLSRVDENNVEASKKFFENVLKDGDIRDFSPNITSVNVIRIPLYSNNIKIENAFANVEVTPKNDEVIKLIDKLKKFDKNNKTMDIEKELKEIDFNVISNSLFKSLEEFADIKIIDKGYKYKNPNEKSLYIDAGEYAIIHTGINENKNYYSTDIAFAKTDKEVIMSIIPYSISRLDDIKNVVLTSSPMIISVLLLLTLFSSIYFSRKIVSPIKKLEQHTKYIKENYLENVERLDLNTKDEIADLSKSVDDMYFDLVKNYNKLKTETKHKDLFLRSTQHQLKTPVAASLLLLESMINKIGKYKDTESYLPEVKSQIISIQNIIEELLNLNKPLETGNKNYVDIKELVENILSGYKIQIDNKDITVTTNFEEVHVFINELLIYKIMDNLISNAISHCNEKGIITFNLNDNEFIIINSGNIPHNIENEIFEPFVSSKNTKKSGGLGLYIVKRYAEAVGFDISVQNISRDEVKTELKIKATH